MRPGRVHANAKRVSRAFGAQTVRNVLCNTSLPVRKAKYSLRDRQAAINRLGAIKLKVSDTISHQNVDNCDSAVISFTKNGRIMKWPTRFVFKTTQLIKAVIACGPRNGALQDSVPILPTRTDTPGRECQNWMLSELF